jgi:hypothetical protein
LVTPPQGNNLTCPPGGFYLEEAPLPGRLDGLFCYSAADSAAVTDATPTANVTTLLHIAREGLSGGAIVGIVIAVLLGVALLAGERPGFRAFPGLGFECTWLRSRRHHD